MTEYPILGIPNIEPVSREQALDALRKCAQELEDMRNRNARLEASSAILKTTLIERDVESRKRLGEVISLRNKVTTLGVQLAKSNDELARFRAALPELIGCAWGALVACSQENRDRDWKLLCCRARAVAVEHGLLPQPEHQSEPEDGV